MRLLDEFIKVGEYCSPKIIGEVNDVFVKVAIIMGSDIPWHNHKDEDELFYVVDGEMLFEIEGEKSFTMRKGDLFIVKKGINHRVSAKNECKIMLIEPKATEHTGNIITSITKSIKEQA